MLSNLGVKYGTTGFRFKASHQNRVVGIYALGWEKRTSTSYYWDGLTRSEENIIVFQYTLKGKGEIKIKDQIYDLGQKKAFFVKIPSNHQYYLPAHSEEWEFIHLTLFGEEANNLYQRITNEEGKVFSLELNSKPISIIIDLLKDVSNRNINDAYKASAKAFMFLMELYRFSLKLENNKEWPDSITKATIFIENNYAKDISLDDIVEVSGLSKYHFTRLFHQTIHLTPIQYLKKLRMNKAIELLKDESLTIEEIARKIGYSNGNYFSKVFRSSIGLSPGEFRNSKKFGPIDHLISDY